MRKSKLLELLNKIEGDPEVYLWNGFVGDWVDIDPDLQETKFYKECKQIKFNNLIAECAERLGTWELPPEEVLKIDKLATEQFENGYWDLPNPFTNDDERKRWYGDTYKRVVIMQAKEKGCSSWDRSGTIQY